MAPTISTRLLASTLAVVLAGCTATVPGVARMGVDASNSDDVTVSLLDTGAYPVTAGHPYGAAGTQAGNLIESQRMGDFVSGPWQIDSTLRALLAVPTLPVDPSLLHDSGTLVDPVPDIAAAHGYIAGFSSDRKSPGPNPQRSLQNMVMRFGDPQSAVAAVQEIAAKANTDPAGRPVGIDGHSEASAWAYTQSDGAVEVRSYAAHGVYILNQSASADHDFDNGFQARLMIGGALTQQERTIDQFIPTDPGKLADLPMDPSGWLLARVLWAPDGKAPRSVGVYGPRAALHFEQDPVESDALFAAAGLEWTGQRLAKVYQTKTADGAARIAAKLVEQAKVSPGVKPTPDGVPGLPSAKCFVRSSGYASPQDPPTLQQAHWHFMCVARADRFAFVTFSLEQKDAMQQASAQWRILAGK